MTILVSMNIPNILDCDLEKKFPTKRDPELLGKWPIPDVEQKMYKMSLEHVVIAQGSYEKLLCQKESEASLKSLSVAKNGST